MEAMGQAARGAGRVYFAGGATAVLLGWRESTIDVDLVFDPEPAGIFEALQRIKDELDVNIELAAPHHFIPPLPGWRERSPFIAAAGPIQFHHYDLHAQALSKIERGHVQDAADLAAMLDRGLVLRERLRELFRAIEPELARYPALDPATFRAKVERATGGAGGG